MSDGELLVSVEDGVMQITLNRPDRKNAFTPTMIDSWADAVQAAQADAAVGCVVVTGAGSAFCSGGDVQAMAARSEEAPFDSKSYLWEHVQRLVLLMESLDKPTIAAINGPAVGAGLDLALMCDLRLAASSAVFSEAYAMVGLVPGAGGTYFLPRLVGLSRALELLWTGRRVTATEAADLGLVNRVVQDEELMTETLELARRLASGPSVALRTIKRAVYQGMRMDLRTHLDMLSSHYAVIRSTQDHKEGVAAFKEKRPPKFSGQ